MNMSSCLLNPTYCGSDIDKPLQIVVFLFITKLVAMSG